MTIEEALKVYESAVVKENIGSLGDAVKLYRAAIRVSRLWCSLRIVPC